MNQRLQATFQQLSVLEKKALIPYITAGDPNATVTLALLETLVASGADILELGVPFSDPVADGEVIQAAHNRALEHGMTLRKTLEVVAEFRKNNQKTPIVLMTYCNPIESFGYKKFIDACAEFGVDGVLTVDLPLEEGEDFFAGLKEKNIDPIFLIAPNTSKERVKKIASFGAGFLYYVSLQGVTGANNLDLSTVTSRLTEIKEYTSLPMAVGFGIRDAESAGHIAQIADGIIVGSVLVQEIAANKNDIIALKQKIAQIISDIKICMDRHPTTGRC